MAPVRDDFAFAEDYFSFIRNMTYPKDESLVEVQCHYLHRDFLPLLTDFQEKQQVFEQIQNWRVRAINDIRKMSKEKDIEDQKAKLVQNISTDTLILDGESAVKAVKAKGSTAEQLDELDRLETPEKKFEMPEKIEPESVKPTFTMNKFREQHKKAGAAQVVSPKNIKKKEAVDEDDQLAAFMGRVETLHTLANKLNQDIKLGSDKVDSLDEKMQDANNSLEKDNRQANAMLWSGKMDWWITIALFVASLAMFYFMLLFILSTKIINMW